METAKEQLAKRARLLAACLLSEQRTGEKMEIPEEWDTPEVRAEAEKLLMKINPQETNQN